MKRLLSYLLVICMLFSSVNVFAFEMPTVNSNVETGEVIITGTATPEENVNIVIKKGNKRYFLDSLYTDEEGKYSFKTVVPLETDFTAIVAANKDKIEFEGSTKKKEEDSNTGNSNGDFSTSEKYITLSIDKKTINKGWVLSPTQVEYNKGESVWDVLKRKMELEDISYNYKFTPQYNSIYVKSIDGDGEFDHGSGSGWMYGVNDVYQNKGCNTYKLKSGDRIEWRYTTNSGKDLGEKNNQSTELSTEPSTKMPVEKEGEKEDENEQTNSFDYLDKDEISKWAYEDMKYANTLGIINGYDNKIIPKGKITRAEVTKMVVKMLDLDIDIKQIIKFSDINAEAWYTPYINTAFVNNIIKGCGDLFKPGKRITREQMVTMIVRALNLKTSTTNLKIKDFEKTSDWAKKDVQTAYQYKLINGNDGYFGPKEYVTREMATAIVVRAYKLLEQLGEDDLIKGILDESTEYLLKQVPNPEVGTVGGEWTVFGLARRGVDISADYYEDYYKNVVKSVKQEDAKTSRRWKTKVTEPQRISIALASIGKDPSNVDGINLLDYTWNKGKNMISLSEHDKILGNRQGLNELVFGLISLNLNNSEMPKDATISKLQIIDKIINKYRTKDGGFDLNEKSEKANLDMTAMALQALAPYYKKEGYEHVTIVIDKALDTLAKVQSQNYSNKEATLESTAQVIMALCSLNINPNMDERFINDGKDLITNLMTYYIDGGGFSHLKDGGINQMALEQGYYALVAYERFLNNKTSIYDMSDVK